MVIVWTDNALDILSGIALYYKQERGEGAARKVVSQIKAAVNSLGIFPRMAPVDATISSKEIEHRSLVVSKTYKVIYRLHGDAILIVSIFDCRQNPEKLKQIIKR